MCNTSDQTLSNSRQPAVPGCAVREYKTISTEHTLARRLNKADSLSSSTLPAWAVSV